MCINLSIYLFMRKCIIFDIAYREMHDLLDWKFYKHLSLILGKLFDKVIGLLWFLKMLYHWFCCLRYVSQVTFKYSNKLFKFIIFKLILVNMLMTIYWFFCSEDWLYLFIYFNYMKYIPIVIWDYVTKYKQSKLIYMTLQFLFNFYLFHFFFYIYYLKIKFPPIFI